MESQNNADLNHELLALANQLNTVGTRFGAVDRTRLPNGFEELFHVLQAWKDGRVAKGKTWRVHEDGVLCRISTVGNNAHQTAWPPSLKFGYRDQSGRCVGIYHESSHMLLLHHEGRLIDHFADKTVTWPKIRRRRSR